VKVQEMNASSNAVNTASLTQRQSPGSSYNHGRQAIPVMYTPGHHHGFIIRQQMKDGQLITSSEIAATDCLLLMDCIKLRQTRATGADVLQAALHQLHDLVPVKAESAASLFKISMNQDLGKNCRVQQSTQMHHFHSGCCRQVAKVLQIEEANLPLTGIIAKPTSCSGLAAGWCM